MGNYAYSLGPKLLIVFTFPGTIVLLCTHTYIYIYVWVHNNKIT